MHALRGRPARPQRAQVGEDGGHPDRGQPQLELARRAGRPGEDLETEAVVGNGARRGDLARPAVDDLAALDVAAGRLAVGADPLRRPAEIDDFDVRRPVRHQVRGDRLADDRAEITEAARADLVLHADVIVEQLGVDAEAGERSALALVREQVQRPRGRAFARARAQDVLDHADSSGAGAGEVGHRVAGAQLEHAEPRQPDRVRRHRDQLERAAQGAVARLHGFLEQAVDVADERAIAAAGQHRPVSAVEHCARDAAGFVERARIIEVFGRDEVLQLALQTLRHVARVRVQQDRDAAFSVPDRKALDIAHQSVAPASETCHPTAM